MYRSISISGSRFVNLNSPILSVDAILQLQKIYKADGDSHSWDWLALVSPCVNVLHRLSTKLNVELGSRQGKTHTVPDLQKDISMLMDVLKEHNIYSVKQGRGLDVNDTPVSDIISAGLSSLSHGTSTNNNPLTEFNTQFNCLCEHRNMMPVSALVDNYQPSYSNPVEDLSAGMAVMAPSPIIADSDGTSEEPSKDDTDESKAGSEVDDHLLYDLDELEVESPTLTRLEEDDMSWPSSPIH